MATNKITLGPLPHFKDEWVAGTTYKREAIVTHHGSTYMCVTAGTQIEPSFTYNSSTGEYTVSAGWALIAVGAGADVVEGLAQVSELKNGTLVPAKAENLKAWDEENIPIENDFDDVIRTTAGEDPVDSEAGGILKRITAVSDFACTVLLATAENQLRLKSNGGGAVAVGAGHSDSSVTQTRTTDLSLWLRTARTSRTQRSSSSHWPTVSLQA